MKSVDCVSPIFSIIYGVYIINYIFYKNIFTFCTLHDILKI